MAIVWKAPGARIRFPCPTCKKNPEQLRLLEKWMHAQKPEELFDASGKLMPELKATGADRGAPHGRQPSRQRRTPEAGAAPSRFPRIRSGSPVSREKSGREHASAGKLPARRDEAEHGQFPGASARTRTPPTSSMPSTRSARSSGSKSIFPRMRTAPNWLATGA